MEFSQWFGFVAAGLTTGSFIPQVIKILKTKQAKGISIAMYIIYVIGISFWLLYGIMIKQYPIIFANTLTLLLSSTVLLMKIKYK
ncbi:MAG: SemiSWEET transporter [Chloroflexota bacterium]